MGLFNKAKAAPKQEIQYYTCLYCGKIYSEENFNKEKHLCNTCAMVSASFKDSFFSTLESYQKQADEAKEVNSKIMYLKLKLNYIYEYKINYYNKGIHLMNDVDVEGLIDDVVDQISRVRI